MSVIDNRDELKNLLEAASGSFTVPPRAEAWQQIETAINPRRRKRRVLWLLLPAAAASIAAAWLLWPGTQPEGAASQAQVAVTASAPAKHTGETPPLQKTAQAAVLPKNASLAGNTTPQHLQGNGIAYDYLQATKMRSAALPSFPGLQEKRDPNKKNKPPYGQPTEQWPQQITNSPFNEAPDNDKMVVQQQNPALPAATWPDKLPVALPETGTKPPPVQDVAIAKVMPVQAAASKKYQFFASAFFGGGYRTLNTNTGSKSLSSFSNIISGSRNSDIDGSELNHQAAINWSAGVGVSRKLGKKWRIETGVEYTQAGYHINAYDATPIAIDYDTWNVVANTISSNLNSTFAAKKDYNSPVQYNNGVPVVISGSSRKLSNKRQFISIPVQLVYSAGNAANGKRQFYVRGGATVHVNAAKNKDYIYSPETKRYFVSEDLQRNNNVSLNIEPGFNLQVGKNHQVQVGLQANYMLQQSYLKPATVKEHLVSGGIRARYYLR
jgi:hypothetical protein